MEDPKSRDEELNELVKAWHDYGAQFSAFVPRQQPAPTVWEPDVEQFDHKGRTDPNYLKHWKFFARTKEFLRQRYTKHNILRSPALVFDCLIRQFQPRIFNKSYTHSDGTPIHCDVHDTDEWYEQAIRMYIWEWQIGFTCRSNLCERDWCLLNRRNPKKMVAVDVYSLISVFEGISVAAAKIQLGKWFNLKLGEFVEQRRPPIDPAKAESVQECHNGRAGPLQEYSDTTRSCFDFRIGRDYQGE